MNERQRQLQKAVQDVGMIGAQMSNLCYNFGQPSWPNLTVRDRECMSRLAREWDAAWGQLFDLTKPKVTK